MSQDKVNRIASIAAVRKSVGAKVGFDLDKMLSAFEEKPDEKVVAEAVKNAETVRKDMEGAAKDPSNVAALELADEASLDAEASINAQLAALDKEREKPTKDKAKESA